MTTLIKSRKGSLLIESIVALSVTTVGILGVLGLLSRSVAINKDVSQKFVATYLAAEGIEVVKSLIDKNVADVQPWNNGIGGCSSPPCDYEVGYGDTALSTSTARFLEFDSATGVYSYGSGSPTPFKRKITITETDLDGSGTDQLRVISTVSWTARAGTETVALEDYFFNWR